MVNSCLFQITNIIIFSSNKNPGAGSLGILKSQRKLFCFLDVVYAPQTKDLNDLLVGILVE